ncbi:MAG: glycyl radical enzyme, partial [Clostridia bacterium]|nr:glycyl radical enzyme [Clostridia bacterium]
LTELVIKSTMDLGFSSQNLCLRVREEIQQALWQLTHEILSHGQGLPALYNDKTLIDCFLSAGYPIEDARDYCLAGCSQSMIPGRSNFMNDIGIFNVAKVISVTLNNGYEPYRKIETGLKTGNAESFKSFGDFYDAFVKQLIYYCNIEVSSINKDTLYRASCEGYALRCLLIRDCIERGKGIFDGGPVYRNIQLECIGITNAADSLMAVKQLVFDEKRLTLSEFNEILNNNYKDNEELRQYIINKVPKFGNDENKVDTLRRDITKIIFDSFRSGQSVIGGVFVPGEVIFVAHDYDGNVTGALPDGRLEGTVLADSAGASQGRDKNGPTALMNSIYKIPVDGLITSVILNMKFIKSIWCENSEKYISLLKAFFKNGGQQIQINVCDNKVLREALENPELHPNLIIRVGGYSAYFNGLSRALKEEIIERSSHV